MAKGAISLFDRTEAARLKPNDGTIISILSACAESGLLGLEKRVHASIERTRYKYHTHVSNALVDMYAKCGSVHRALSIFNGMAKRDLVFWNAVIQGLAMHGHREKALHFFSRTKQEGFPPDKVTSVGVLCACTHAGRGGRVKEAFRLVRSMPMEPNAIIWDAGNFSMLSNIYASARDWRSVASVRMQMKNTGTQKPSGASSIELDVDVHEFTVVDRSHPKSDGIYQMIDGLDAAPMLHKFTLKRKAIDLQIGAQSFMERVGSTELVVARALWRSSFLKLVVVSTIEESISPMQEFSARCAVEYLRHMQNKVPKKYHYLKVVEVVGFAGSTVVEFITCVLEYVVSLEKFILNPHCPWNGELPSQYDDNFIPMQQLARESTIKMAAKLPPGVKFVVISLSPIFP
ncbi:Pentatricopeptide repeat-containing protein [Camellia lanceoleosa]|uniref:Pentatricopeptide repeat-containing protein n=1 Tax=Camellia lanceoleosa TaxID=1840588 RepID=A0ACC0HBH9_9ERIC|nr:Pentatricopeptide repeat-containing protein [Camellia lanceoleosa]